MKKFTILVIDDYTGDGTFIQEILVANDFLVRTATDKKEALQMLAGESFDLIFIEASMSGKEGFTISQLIKSDGQLCNIPVIFIIGRDDLVWANEIFDSGGDDFIIKPLNWSGLIMKTRVHLELKYSRQMARNMNQMLEARVAQRTLELEDSLKKLWQAKKELEMLEIAKSEFLNLISHEIRTPLNGILGSLALIGRFNFSDEVNRYFSLLDTSVRRLEKFSYTILEASTLRMKGEKALILKELDLFTVLQTAIQQCSEKFSDKGIAIDLQNQSTNSVLKGDQKYLLQCFTAVLDNAFKFSPRGGKLEISIDNTPDEYLEITIADRGKGFSKSALDNIFSPLSNLEGHFDQNTGMGLHLAKLIMNAHSGTIKVQNRTPNGALVEILIPSSH